MIQAQFTGTCCEPCTDFLFLDLTEMEDKGTILSSLIYHLATDEVEQSPNFVLTKKEALVFLALLDKHNTRSYPATGTKDG